MTNWTSALATAGKAKQEKCAQDRGPPGMEKRTFHDPTYLIPISVNRLHQIVNNETKAATFAEHMRGILRHVV